MTYAQALRYFVHEALISLVRSWKVSMLAVLTISVSLFVCAFLLLLSNNLDQRIAEWQQRARVIVYLHPAAGSETMEELSQQLEAAPWVTGVEAVSTEQAGHRFEELFPSMADLVRDEPLPASLEVSFQQEGLDLAAFGAWSEELRANPAVAMVDDDRDWLRQLRTILTVVRGFGLTLGGVLLIGAVFTIASVVRLTAYLYQEEIEIMRIVGATEFFIRGPFYLEGMFQGLIGGLLALAELYVAYALLQAQALDSLWGRLLLTDFLGLHQQVAMVGLGALAGLIGAIASLRRESLRQVASSEEDSASGDA